MSGRWAVTRRAGSWWAEHPACDISCLFRALASDPCGSRRFDTHAEAITYATEQAAAQEVREWRRIGVDRETRRALLTFAASGATVDVIQRLWLAYAKGLRIEIVNDHYPWPDYRTPGVYGVRGQP